MNCDDYYGAKYYGPPASLGAFLQVLGIILGAFVLVFLVLWIAETHGQDLDPRYYCIENPHYRSCDLQLQKDKQDIMDIVEEALTLADNDSAWYNDSMKRSLNSSK